jgi:hypothetical protein
MHALPRNARRNHAMAGQACGRRKTARPSGRRPAAREMTMKTPVLGLLLLAVASPAAAENVAECRSIGGHHYYNDRISAARYIRLSGSRMMLTGRTGRTDMPRWSLPCATTPTGLFCAGGSRSMSVSIKTDGSQMQEMVQDRRTGAEAFHIVYNCNRELSLP